MSRHSFKISIPKDEDGFIGRECLECKRYFKLKPGTGLPTEHCHCPYCDYEGSYDTFWTEAQLAYAESLGKKIAYEQIIRPMLDDLTKSIKNLERSARNSFLKVQVKTSRSAPFFPIKYYNEFELETNLTCDNCKLEFAIYGVFSQCPDCNKLNAFSIYKKSIEVSQKQFDLFQNFKNDEEVTQTNLKFILSNAISAFDGLGKELRNRIPNKFPSKPQNLFQNINELEKTFKSNFNFDLNKKAKDLEFVKLNFQIRHIYEHNMGVIDDHFLKRNSQFNHLKGRKFKLESGSIKEFLSQMNELGYLIEQAVQGDLT